MEVRMQCRCSGNQSRFTGRLNNICINVGTTLHGQKLTGATNEAPGYNRSGNAVSSPESGKDGRLSESKNRSHGVSRERLFALSLLCSPALALRVGNTLACFGAQHAGLRLSLVVFLVLRAVVVDEPEPASRVRTWVSREISESIWARIESIAIALRITQCSHVCIGIV